MKTTILKVSVHADKENPVFGEQSTHIEIKDEAGGAFIVLTQPASNANAEGELRFDIEELGLVASEAKKMIESIPEF